jgi:AraC-like DNA-binding protein
MNRPLEPIRLLRTTYLSAYLYALRENHVNPSPLLEKSGIPADFEFLADYMLPSNLLHHFIQSAVDSAAPGTISTAAGLYNAAHQSNPFSDTVRSCRNLADAIHQHNANIAAYSPDNRFDINVLGARGYWRKLGRSPTAETETFCVANLIGHVRTVVGDAWFPEHIEVAVADPGTLQTLSLLAKVSVRKVSRHTTITLPARLLRRSIGGRRRRSDAANGNGSATAESDFLATLRTIMKSYARTGDLNVRIVASAVGTSTRTLQRHLHQHGVSYTRLADQIRFEVASSLLLSKPELGITQIAYELGYRDPGSFSRAFRRRAGMAPVTYRHRFASTTSSAA